MKLLIVTVIEQFHKEILQLFKKAGIENFSGSDIDGYKNTPSLLRKSSWFPTERNGTESNMYFSFTSEEKIDGLFTLIEEFNKNMESNSPIKAVVVPIEKHI